MSRLTTRQRAAAAALVLIALAFCVLDLAGAPLAGARTGVRGAFGSLYRGTDVVLGTARNFVQGPFGANAGTIGRLQQQNADLRREVDAAQAQVRASGQTAALAALGNTLGETVLPARVVGLAPGQGFEWTVTLGVGRGDGVQVDQTVVSGDALVGRILHVDGSSCVVLLAADPGGGVGVRLDRTGQLGVVTGRGPSGMSLAPLDPGAQIQAGDLLRTGPAGATTFVAGLKVGTVRSVVRGADGATTATVAPAVSATSLDVVGIVLTVPVTTPAAGR